jgi:hypothetical protein
MLKVLCVLKSGGQYRPKYVRVLRDAVKRRLKVEHEFICLTDIPKQFDFECKTERLQNNLPGWWSKIEIFRHKGPCIFLDLDTLLLGSLDKLAKELMEYDANTPALNHMYMLTPFNKGHKWASGVMAWSGDFTKIYKDISLTIANKFRMDQKYIVAKLEEMDYTPTPIQDCIEVLSYKHHCKDKKPRKSCIVCFHGRPRPHQVTTGWVPDVWKIEVAKPKIEVQDDDTG